MPADRAAQTAVRICVSLADKFDGMLHQAAVGIEDKRAGKIHYQVAAERIELRGHEEETSVLEAADIVDVPFVRDKPDFFRSNVGYRVTIDPSLGAQKHADHARDDLPPSHRPSAPLRPTRPCRR